MKHLKYIIASILITSQCFAGLPPTSVKGQSDSSSIVKFNFQTPNNQITDLGGPKALIETGNDNLLKNPGFEAATVDTGWTCTSMNQESTTTAEDTPIKGKQSIEFKPTDATSRCYQQVTAQSADIGKLGEFSLTTKVLNVGTTHDWWLQILNSAGTVVEAESQILFDSTNSVTTKVEFQIESSQRVQITTKSDSPDQIIADDASFKPATNIGTIAQAKVVLSTVGSGSAQSIPGSSAVTTVTNWATPTVGDDHFSSGVFTNTEDGECLVTASLLYSSVLSTIVAARIFVYKNGVSIGSQVGPKYSTSSAPQMSIQFECKSGDTIDVRTSQGESSSKNIDGGAGSQWFSISRFPSKAQQAITPSDQVDVTGGGLWFPDACPSGMVDAENKVVGKSSGDYQGARYLNLYRHLWTNAATSSSAYVLSATKGASADADWAAGTTITINMGGIFPRVHGGTSPNVSGDLGALQLDAFQGHKHDMWDGLKYTLFAATGSPGAAAINSAGTSQSFLTGTPESDGTHGTPRVASETRPYNTAMKFCMFANPVVPQPVLLGGVTSNPAGIEVIERATLNHGASSTCSVISQSGSWIVSGTRNATGDCTWAIDSGIFGSTPSCTCTYHAGNPSTTNTCQLGGTSSATSIRTVTNIGGTNSDGTAEIICMGPK